MYGSQPFNDKIGHSAVNVAFVAEVVGHFAGGELSKRQAEKQVSQPMVPGNHFLDLSEPLISGKLFQLYLSLNQEVGKDGHNQVML
jgi:hypothetical protein